ncbi:hypothetical protein HNR33_000874 [Brassicibacter mesophilus]
MEEIKSDLKEIKEDVSCIKNTLYQNELMEVM